MGPLQTPYLYYLLDQVIANWKASMNSTNAVWRGDPTTRGKSKYSAILSAEDAPTSLSCITADSKIDPPIWFTPNINAATNIQNTDVKTFECNITNAKWVNENGVWVFKISANRFLRNMVRAIVGTLIEIGLNKYDIQHIEKVINSKNRQNAGYSVPAHGLYLTNIIYPALNINE